MGWLFGNEFDVCLCGCARHQHPCGCDCTSFWFCCEDQDPIAQLFGL